MPLQCTQGKRIKQMFSLAHVLLREVCLKHYSVLVLTQQTSFADDLHLTAWKVKYRSIDHMDR